MTRRRRSGLIGPLASWDLLRLARRGQAVRGRTVLAGGLFVALALLTVSHFRHESPANLLFGTAQALSIQESAEFGNRFTLTVIFAQLGLLCLLTPAYAAGAIAEEKERQTFQLLLVSDLSGWELFAGLLAGRVVFVLGLMLAGLPVLALALLYGGVSLLFVGMSYVLTATTVAMLAAMSAAGAAACNTFRGALLRGYALALGAATGFGTFFLSPFAVLPYLYDLQPRDPVAFLWVGGGFAAAELLIAAVATAYGVQWVRQLRARPVRRRPPPPTAYRPPPPPPRPADRLPPAAWHRPPVSGQDPFAWKERYIRGTKRTLDDDSLQAVLQGGGVMVAVVVGAFLLIAGGAVLSAAMGGGTKGLEAAGGLLVAAGVLGHAPYLLVAGAAAGRNLIVERQRNTLESLLAMPTDRGEVLRPKWAAAARTGLAWGLPAGLCLPLGFLLTDAPLVAVPSLLLVLVGGPLAASLGMWLSLRCQTATRALLWWLPVLGGLVGVQVVLYKLGDAGWEVPLAGAVLAGLVAGVAWRLWQQSAAAFEKLGRN